MMTENNWSYGEMSNNMPKETSSPSASAPALNEQLLEDCKNRNKSSKKRKKLKKKIRRLKKELENSFMTKKERKRLKKEIRCLKAKIEAASVRSESSWKKRYQQEHEKVAVLKYTRELTRTVDQLEYRNRVLTHLIMSSQQQTSGKPFIPPECTPATNSLQKIEQNLLTMIDAEEDYR